MPIVRLGWICFRILTEIVPEMAAQKVDLGSVQSHDLPELRHIVMFGTNGRGYR